MRGDSDHGFVVDAAASSGEALACGQACGSGDTAGEVASCDHCAEPAVVISPGSDEVRLRDHGFLIKAAVADRRWCMEHARAAGWPWLTCEKRRTA